VGEFRWGNPIAVNAKRSAVKVRRAMAPVYTRSDAVDPFQTGPAVEIGVKAEDRLNAVVFHDGDVERVPSGKRGPILRDLSGAQHIGFFDCEDVVDDIQKRLKCALDGISLVDGDVAVEDFLEHFRAGDQLLLRGNQTLDQDLRLPSVGMWCSNQVQSEYRSPGRGPAR
jgi:hypothetical protein